MSYRRTQNAINRLIDVSDAVESTQKVTQSIASVNGGAQSTGTAAEQLKVTTEGLSSRSQTLIGEVDEFLKKIRDLLTIMVRQ